ncbi:hypothetical protein [Herbidospora yilanensis]|uniref:hypothetical protein n=1 Tax=Herbidospora yilanensis TaxID=354426 RepID=UPI00078231DC|nr:hypothetical protein [Herbidospora yilanensis]
MRALPPEDQLQVLREHGIYDPFMAQWASVDDVGEVARRLGVDMAKTVACDFHAAVESPEETGEGRRYRAWIGRLAPGWSVVVYLDGWMVDSDPLSSGGRHVFDVSCVSGTYEIEELYYTHDGVCDGSVYEAEEYRGYWEDLKYDTASTDGQLAEYLAILGRIAGRFLDREFFSSRGLLIELP